MGLGLAGRGEGGNVDRTMFADDWSCQLRAGDHGDVLGPLDRSPRHLHPVPVRQLPPPLAQVLGRDGPRVLS